MGIPVIERVTSVVWRMRALVVVGSCASRLAGQAPINELRHGAASAAVSVASARGQDSAAVWKAWVALALGSFSGSASEASGPLERSGGELTLWVTRNRLAFGARAAGSGALLDESGGPHTGDVSALVGYRVEPVRRIDGVVAVGVGWNTLTEFLTHYPDQPVIVANVQLVADFYLVGVGVDAFAATGAHRSYAGIGTAFCVGWFR